MAALWNWLKGLLITPPPVIAVVKPAEPVKFTPAKKRVRSAAVPVKKAAAVPVKKTAVKTAARPTKKRK